MHVERQPDSYVLRLWLHETLDQPEEAAAVVRALVKQHGLGKMPVVSLIAPGSHNLMQIEAPDVPPAELRAAIRWRIKDLIDFHIDDAVIDVFEVPGRGNEEHSHLMTAVATRVSGVQQQVDMLQDADLAIAAIDIPELAMRNLAALLPEDIKGVALLNFGRNSGLMTLTRQQNLYLSRPIDVGADSLMQLASPSGASGIDGMDTRLQGLLDRIVLEVQRSLDYYESHFSQAPIASLLLAPLARPVPGMLEYLTANLNLSVRQLDFNTLLQCEQPLGPEIQSQLLLACGAALRQEHREL